MVLEIIECPKGWEYTVESIVDENGEMVEKWKMVQIS